MSITLILFLLKVINISFNNLKNINYDNDDNNNNF